MTFAFIIAGRSRRRVGLNDKRDRQEGKRKRQIYQVAFRMAPGCLQDEFHAFRNKKAPTWGALCLDALVWHAVKHAHSGKTAAADDAYFQRSPQPAGCIHHNTPCPQLLKAPQCVSAACELKAGSFLPVS